MRFVCRAAALATATLAIGGIWRSLVLAHHRPPPRWAIFTTLDCTRFGTPEAAAIKSWNDLVPKPHVYIMAACMPAALADKVTLIDDCDTTFDGHPLFGGMMFRTIERAAATTLDAVAWVNADIILAQNAADTVAHALRARAAPWMIVAPRRNLSPRSMRHWTGKDPERFIKRHGTPHTRGGVDFFAWNCPHKPVVRAPFPPFIRSANIWDNWLVTEAAATRVVADATALISAGHVDHDTQWDAGGRWGTTHTTDPRNRHNRAVLERHQRGFTPGVGTLNHVHVELVPAADGVAFAAKDGARRHAARERRVLSYADAHVKAFAVDRAAPHTIADVTTAYDARTRFAIAPASARDVAATATCACAQSHPPHNRTLLIAATDDAAYTELCLLGLPVFRARDAHTAALAARAQGRDAVGCDTPACGATCDALRGMRPCATVKRFPVADDSAAARALDSAS